MLHRLPASNCHSQFVAKEIVTLNTQWFLWAYPRFGAWISTYKNLILIPKRPNDLGFRFFGGEQRFSGMKTVRRVGVGCVHFFLVGRVSKVWVHHFYAREVPWPWPCPLPKDHWIFLFRNKFVFIWQKCPVLAQCFIYFKLIMDSTVGVKNWIISIFFKQKAIISHVSPDILYLFRVQAVCRNEMRSDFSQTMLFQGKKPTYFYIMTICVFNIFFAECSMAWDDFRRCLNACRHANFKLWPVTLSEPCF